MTQQVCFVQVFVSIVEAYRERANAREHMMAWRASCSVAAGSAAVGTRSSRAKERAREQDRSRARRGDSATPEMPYPRRLDPFTAFSADIVRVLAAQRRALTRADVMRG